MLLERVLAAFERFVVEHPQADAFAAWRIGGAPEHQAMMCPFLEATQEEGILVGMARNEPEHLGIELLGFLQVAGFEHAVTGARGAKVRPVVCLRYLHRLSLPGLSSVCWRILHGPSRNLR